MATGAAINVIKFWTQYTPAPDGTLKGVDMVAYAPIGKADKLTLVESVSRLGKLHPIEMAADNQAIAMAHARWNSIKPAYDAWKNGQAMPDRGTPLGAWSGISQDQAEALKMIGIRSVEEIAEASDSIIDRIPFSGGRSLRTTAQAYLKAADRQALAHDSAQKEAKINALEEQLAEMQKLILEMADKSEAEAPKRRGRPPKVEAEAAE